MIIHIDLHIDQHLAGRGTLANGEARWINALDNWRLDCIKYLKQNWISTGIISSYSNWMKKFFQKLNLFLCNLLIYREAWIHSMNMTIYRVFRICNADFADFNRCRYRGSIDKLYTWRNSLIPMHFATFDGCERDLQNVTESESNRTSCH